MKVDGFCELTCIGTSPENHSFVIPETESATNLPPAPVIAPTQVQRIGHQGSRPNSIHYPQSMRCLSAIPNVSFASFQQALDSEHWLSSLLSNTV